jgi:hypothetical protein
MDANTIGIILGVAGIVIGAIVSYYFYKKSIRIKEPCFDIKSYNLIEGYVSTFEGLEVSYKDQKIENLTVAKVAFWNNGAETINKSDITSADPIRIVGVNGSVILNSKTISANNKANLLSSKLHRDKNAVYIGFDYLDRQQGGIFQVVHTGLRSEDIKIEGTIKGATDLKRRSIRFDDITPNVIAGRINSNTRRVISTVFYIFGGLLFIVFGGAGTIVIFGTLLGQSSTNQNNELIANNPFYIVALPLWLLIGFGMLWMSFAIWRNRPPKGLEVFDEKEV